MEQCAARFGRRDQADTPMQSRGNIDKLLEVPWLSVDPIADPLKERAIGSNPTHPEGVPSLFDGSIVEEIVSLRARVRTQLIKQRVKLHRFVDAILEILKTSDVELSLSGGK